MPIFGVLRIKNEARWIDRVVRSIQPVCDEILVLDDHSTDETAAICRRLGARVYPSRMKGLDESRDKDWLLERAIRRVPQEDQHWLDGNPNSPYWILAIDGDEELVQKDIEMLRGLARQDGPHAWSLRILYLWNAANVWRTDGVYGRFSRPSLFRLMNRKFRYQKTPWGNGANFHCSSIPQELLGHARSSEVRLIHWGYIDRDLRKRKYDWYNQIDANNVGEDCYRHIVQGDDPAIPPNLQLRWAGPLKLEPLCL